MKASKLNFDGQRFSPEEWPEGALSQMDSRVIGAMFDIRNNLPTNCPMFPSPIYEAHVRNDDTGSRHSIDHGARLSDATDFFIRKRDFHKVYLEVVKHSRIGGAGFYNNALFRGSWEDYFMVHIDARPMFQKMLWAADREKGKAGAFTYYSIAANPHEYFKTLNKMGDQL